MALPEDTVTDFERLAVAFADEELIERVGVDANAAELMRVVSVEEGFEFGFVRRDHAIRAATER